MTVTVPAPWTASFSALIASTLLAVVSSCSGPLSEGGSPASSRTPSLTSTHPLTVEVAAAGHWDAGFPFPDDSVAGDFVDTVFAPAGFVYAAGYLGGEGHFDFGNGVKTASDGYSGLLVKYDPDGTAQWAVAVKGTNFRSAAVDSAGAIIVAGDLLDNGAVDFGNGVSLDADSAAGTGVLLVKYSPDGLAQWAVTNHGVPRQNFFMAAACDALGNIYAAGVMVGTADYEFGNGIEASAIADDELNLLLVKYSSAGVAQWAKTVTGGDWRSEYRGLAVSGNGDCYAVGGIRGQETYDFGNGVTLTGVSKNTNAVAVKYDSSGVTQWARSTGISQFAGNIYFGAALDGTGHLYVAGIGGNGSVGFGDGVSLSVVGPQAVLVKYAVDGTALWARAATYLLNPSHLDSSAFNDVAVDSDGNIHAAGYGDDLSDFGFGNGVEIGTGRSRAGHALLVRYSPDGTAQRGQGVLSEPDDGGTVISQGSVIYGLSAGPLGAVFASGYIGLGTYELGAGQTIASDYEGAKPFLIRYR